MDFFTDFQLEVGIGIPRNSYRCRLCSYWRCYWPWGILPCYCTSLWLAGHLFKFVIFANTYAAMNRLEIFWEYPHYHSCYIQWSFYWFIKITDLLFVCDLHRTWTGIQYFHNWTGNRYASCPGLLSTVDWANCTSLPCRSLGIHVQVVEFRHHCVAFLYPLNFWITLPNRILMTSLLCLDRVTCRDWFQLSLKEGLTVFRDQVRTFVLLVRARLLLRKHI